MLNLDRILQNDRVMRAMTGLNRQAFEALLPSFSEAYQQSLKRPGFKRQRAPGGGRKATLGSAREKLFYILVYCKCYSTFDVMGVLFDFDRSTACQWAHRLLTVLEQALGQKQVLPARKIESIAEFVERFPDVQAVIFDGKERPIQRPQDDERQLDEAEIVENIPNAVVIEGDLGFQGLQNEFENVHLPHKKPRGKELSEQQKQENRDFSAQRVVCEHAHAGIKRYNAVAAVYRNRVPDFDDRLMLNAAGLWNFYLEAA